MAFDVGYGPTQLTNPKPKYNEAWDWKSNIRTGIELYLKKRKTAETYLKGNGKRIHTEEQLQLETWCLWNSGHYHKWDEKNKKWIRDPPIVSDNQTENIELDITKGENKGNLSRHCTNVIKINMRSHQQKKLNENDKGRDLALIRGRFNVSFRPTLGHAVETTGE